MSRADDAGSAPGLPIRARLVAMSDRTRALLEYHFDHAGRRVFTIAPSAESADVIIVDYDYPGARADIESGKWCDGPPLMVLMHGEVGPREARVTLRKPLDGTRLDAAALELMVESSSRERPLASDMAGEERAEREEGAARAREGEVDEDAGEKRGVVHRRTSRAAARRAASEAVLERRRAARVETLCGPPRSLAELSSPDDADHRHDPARYPLAHLVRARAAACAGTRDEEVAALSLVFDGTELHLLPWLQRVLTSISLERRDNVERLFRPYDDEEVEVRFHSPAQVKDLVDKVTREARHAFSVESAAWLFSLFAARGRLPFGVDVERPCRLRHWPNLTRLERTPEAIRIAALWSLRSISIGEVIARLGCEPRFVTAFYTGASASGLIDTGADIEASDEAEADDGPER